MGDGTRMAKIGNPAVAARAKITLKDLFGNFWGCLKVCVISGFGPHRSGGDGSGGEDSPAMGLIDAKWCFKGVESPNDAMIKDNLRVSAYNNWGGRCKVATCEEALMC